jgi:hypothetical protein
MWVPLALYSSSLLIMCLPSFVKCIKLYLSSVSGIVVHFFHPFCMYPSGEQIKRLRSKFQTYTSFKSTMKLIIFIFDCGSKVPPKYMGCLSLKYNSDTHMLDTIYQTSTRDIPKFKSCTHRLLQEFF